MNPIEEALANRPKWMDEGICAQTDPDAFYPEKGGSTAPAKLICMRCPVAGACLEYAQENHEYYGIWGGLSARERRRLREPVRQFGPPNDDPDLIRRVRELLAQDFHPDVVASLAGTSSRTVCRIRDMHENGAAA